MGRAPLMIPPAKLATSPAGRACVLAALLCACAPEPAVDDAEGKGSPLVFVHGLKGAHLSGRDGERLWLTRSQGLGLTTPDLRLRANDGVRPGPLLRSLFVVPWLLGEEVYGPWLAALHATGRPVRVFTYDWRRDNEATLSELRAFVERARADHGNEAVELIGHSNGGLLVLALLSEDPTGVRRAVLAGAPLAGGIGFLPDLHVGRPNGLNERILSREVLGTFPSAFSLFPLSQGDAVDEEGRVLPVDFYSVDSWRQHRLGPPDLREEVLAAARRFRERLVARPVAYPPILVVAGVGQPTLTTAVRRAAGWDFDAAPRQPGDGRVGLERAKPPAGIGYRLVTSEAEHAQLLNDPAVVEAILSPEPR